MGVIKERFREPSDLRVCSATVRVVRGAGGVLLRVDRTPLDRPFDVGRACL